MLCSVEACDTGRRERTRLNKSPPRFTLIESGAVFGLRDVSEQILHTDARVWGQSTRLCMQ
jgi:hypothetical protein